MAGHLRNLALAGVGIAVGLGGMWAMSGRMATAVSAAVAELNPDAWMDSEEGVLAKLDELAGLPGDPDLPEGVVGATDEQIASLDEEMRAGLIELGEIASQGANAAPRHSVALARLKASVGDEAAIGLLEQSAQAGSAAAHALLGQMAAQSEDTEAAATLAIDHYKKAVEGGYEPARAPMERIAALLEAAREQQRLAIEAKKKELFAKFKRPEYIDALKRADAGYFRDEGLHGLGYLSILNQVLEAPELAQEIPGLASEIDPRAATIASQNIAFNPKALDEASEMAMGNMWGFLTGIAEVRKRGGSMGEEMAAGMRGLTTNTIGNDVEDAKHDAVILAGLFVVDPETFREIYAGNLAVLQGL